MSEVDESLEPEQELYELTRAFRQHLEWLRRAGAHAVSARPSPREGADDTPALDHALDPPETETAHQSHANTTAPAMRDDALLEGGLSAALARALGEDEPRRPRAAQRPAPPPAPSRPSTAQPSTTHENDPLPEPRLTLAEIRAELGDCQRCKLARTRKTIVFGQGDAHAPLMFIGEAPGEEEDNQGVPFVGAAGKLLSDMIKAMGWTRETVYIANVLKCRPPGNRDPEPDEVAACRPFLARQIAAVAPRVIVTLGRPAAHLVLDTDVPISDLRGRFRDYQGIKVMPTFHPAYLLRKPEQKRAVWNDLKLVIAELERLGVRPPHAPRK